MKKIISLIFFIQCLCFYSHSNEKKDYILCINSFAESFPWSNRLVSELIDYAHVQKDFNVTFEHLQFSQIKNINDFDLIRKYIAKTYGSSSPKALVIIGSPAYLLRDEYRRLWGDIPIILYSSRDFTVDRRYYAKNDTIDAPRESYVKISDLANEYNTVLFYTNLFIKESVEYIKYRHPNLEKLILIRGSKNMDADIVYTLNTLLKSYQPAITLEPIDTEQMSTTQMVDMIDSIDTKKTAILFSTWLSVIDRGFGVYVNNSPILLAGTCKTPIYTLNLSDVTTYGGHMHSGYSFDFNELKSRFREVLNMVCYENIQPREIKPFYPTEGRPYVLCNVAFPRGLSYSDFPADTVFLNKPESFFEKYKVLIIITFSLLFIAAIFLLYRSRVLHTKNAEKKRLLSKQEDLITDLNLSLKSAKIVRWRRNESTGELLLMNHLMDEIVIRNEDLPQFVKTDEDEERIKEFFKNISGNTITSLVVKLYTPWNNSYKPYEISAIAVRDKSDKKRNMIYGVCRDISESYDFQQQLISKVELLETIKDTMPIGLTIYDKDGTQQSCNNAVCKMFGIHTATTANFFTVLAHLGSQAEVEHMLLKEKVMQIKGNYNQIEPYIKELIVEGAPHGEFFEFLFAPILDKNGEVYGYISLCIDATIQMNTQKELIAAKNKAEESDRLKSAFLTNMSHEIRTPLNAIIGFSELLLETDNPTEKTEFFKIISSNNEMLLKLITDVFDISKIESNTIELHAVHFDINKVCDELYQSFKSRYETDDVAIQMKLPFLQCIVLLDEARIIQIISNYLSNAVKYTSKGSITMGYEYKNEELFLYVQDTGVGISFDKFDLLFQRFEKLDSFAQGSGLGLPICKALVEAMNGKVGVSSEEGKGSMFWACIPCKADTLLNDEAHSTL